MKPETGIWVRYRSGQVDRVMTYYEFLGVKEDATHEELKSVYRRKAREWHPDLNGGDESKTKAFKVLAEIWAVLGNPSRRRNYDERLYFARRPQRDVMVTFYVNSSDTSTNQSW